MNFAFSNSFNTSVVLPGHCDPLELQKLLHSLQTQQEAYKQMKPKRKLDSIMDAFKELKRLFVNDKVLCEVYDEIGKMAKGLLDTMVERKHQIKNESRDACEKLKGDILNLEN